MKILLKTVMLFLVFSIFFNNIVIAYAEKNQNIIINPVEVQAGQNGQMIIEVNGFEDLVGAYYFELDFPEFITINSVSRDQILLDESNYNIWNDNILIICEEIGYMDSNVFFNQTLLTINFTANNNVTTQGDVILTDESYIVYEENYEEIPLAEISQKGSIKSIVANELKADINKDGTANSIDLSLLRQKLLKIVVSDTFNESIADVNNDSIIDIKDLVAIKKYLIRSIVYLSDNGNDSNIGDSITAPVATLNKAIEQVYENGTIIITDKYTASAIWNNINKSITISGEIFDATSLSALSIGNDTTFSNITLKFKDDSNIYANGNKLIIAQDTNVVGTPYLYGGGLYDVDSTNIEIYSGSYKHIYGGGNWNDVLTDTNVIIGGTVNSNIDETNHSLPIYVVGGGHNSTVKGNTNITINDNAKSVHIYGGGYGSESKVLGNTNVNINGGSFMSAYAGSLNGYCNNTNLTMTGGTIEQIFGGCQKTSMIGNSTIKVLSGTITRRIYGGCYNEADYSLLSGPDYFTDYFVNGTTTVLIGSKVNYTHSGSQECAISAGSRNNINHPEENAILKFENESIYKSVKNYIGSSLMEVSGYDSLYISDIKQ